MGIKVYIASITGNTEIKKQIQRVLMILDGLKVDYAVVDITEPGKKEEREFMRNNGKSRGASVPLPPQIFFDQDYCGDYEDFDNANEENKLRPFLKLQDSENEGVEVRGDSGVLNSKKEDENHNESVDEVNGGIAENGEEDEGMEVGKEEGADDENATEEEKVEASEETAEATEDVEDEKTSDSEKPEPDVEDGEVGGGSGTGGKEDDGGEDGEMEEKETENEDGNDGEMGEKEKSDAEDETGGDPGDVDREEGEVSAAEEEGDSVSAEVAFSEISSSTSARASHS